MMSNLRLIELRLIDDLFESASGYVLDFTNRTFAEFFTSEVGVDIYDDAYADAGNSKGKRLRTFLQKGQKPAVAKALTALWEYRQDQLRRSGREDPVREAQAGLSAIIERLGGQPLPGPRRPAEAARKTGEPSTFARLAQSFDALHPLEPQARGYAFERFLADLFDSSGLQARRAFRRTGEQIDGSFRHEGNTYLLEARWQQALTDAAQLHAFQGKVESRPDWARGLFVSYSGFSQDGLQAFSARRILLMDGYDIHEALRRQIPMGDVIGEKLRRAVEFNTAFVKVRDLFPMWEAGVR